MQENSGSRQHQYIYWFILSYNIDKRAVTSILTPVANLSLRFLCTFFIFVNISLPKGVKREDGDQKLLEFICFAIWLCYLCDTLWYSVRFVIFICVILVCFFHLSYLALIFACIKRSLDPKSNLPNVFRGGSLPSCSLYSGPITAYH